MAKINESHQYIYQIFSEQITPSTLQELYVATLDEDTEDLKSALEKYGYDVSNLTTKKQIVAKAYEVGLQVETKPKEEVEAALTDWFIKHRNYKENNRVTDEQYIKNIKRELPNIIGKEGFETVFLEKTKSADGKTIYSQAWDLGPVLSIYKRIEDRDETFTKPSAIRKGIRNIGAAIEGKKTYSADARSQIPGRIEKAIDSIKSDAEAVYILKIIDKDIQKPPEKSIIASKVRALELREAALAKAIKLDEKLPISFKSNAELLDALNLKGISPVIPKGANVGEVTNLIRATAAREGIGLKEFQKSREEKIADILAKDPNANRTALIKLAPVQLNRYLQDLNKQLRYRPNVFINESYIPEKKASLERLFKDKLNQDFDEVLNQKVSALKSLDPTLNTSAARIRALNDIKLNLLPDNVKASEPLILDRWQKYKYPNDPNALLTKKDIDDLKRLPKYLFEDIIGAPRTYRTLDDIRRGVKAQKREAIPTSVWAPEKVRIERIDPTKPPQEKVIKTPIVKSIEDYYKDVIVPAQKSKQQYRNMQLKVSKEILKSFRKPVAYVPGPAVVQDSAIAAATRATAELIGGDEIPFDTLSKIAKKKRNT